MEIWHENECCHNIVTSFLSYLGHGCECNVLRSIIWFSIDGITWILCFFGLSDPPLICQLARVAHDKACRQEGTPKRHALRDESGLCAKVTLTIRGSIVDKIARAWDCLRAWVPKTWGPKPHLSGPYFCTQDWTQAQTLVSQTRRLQYLLNWGLLRFDLTWQWCHTRTTSFFVPWT